MIDLDTDLEEAFPNIDELITNNHLFSAPLSPPEVWVVEVCPQSILKGQSMLICVSPASTDLCSNWWKANLGNFAVSIASQRLSVASPMIGVLKVVMPTTFTSNRASLQIFFKNVSVHVANNSMEVVGVVPKVGGVASKGTCKYTGDFDLFLILLILVQVFLWLIKTLHLFMLSFLSLPTYTQVPLKIKFHYAIFTNHF